MGIFNDSHLKIYNYRSNKTHIWTGISHLGIPESTLVKEVILLILYAGVTKANVQHYNSKLDRG